MKTALYSQLLGVDSKSTSLVSPEVAFRKMDNFLLKKELQALKTRGGSTSDDVTGDVWGIAGYAKDTTNHRTPIQDIPVRHRRVGTTSYIEKLTLSTDTWTALTLGVNTNFDIGNIAGFAQIKDLLCICAGRPAKMTSDSGTITRLGGSAPAAPSIGSSGTGLTGTYRYVLTFKDTTSGWESSPSVPSAEVTVANKQIDLSSIPTTADREDVDYVNIYRTIGTNEAPYRYVGQVSLGTTTYADTVADSALGEAAPDFNDHDSPPDGAYVVAAHKNRIWIADTNNRIWYSQADDGTGVPLEYFSPLRTEFIDNRVTAMVSNHAGGLFLFQPPGFGIKEVVGRFADDNDFEIVERFPREGTYFHPSVKVGGREGKTISFFGRGGWKFISAEGIQEFQADRVDGQFDDALVGSYDTDVFAWAEYHPIYKQFILGVAMLDGFSTGWENSQTGATIQWVNSDTAAAVDWELQ